MHGVLIKEGAKRKNWLERFFVFDAETCSLSYFEGSADGKLKGRGAFIRVEDGTSRARPTNVGTGSTLSLTTSSADKLTQ